MAMKIPLYNCYWCKCAYCVFRTNEKCIDKCRLCMMKEKFKMPANCHKFIEDTAAYRIMIKQKNRNCAECKYVKLVRKIDELIKDD